MSLYEQGQLENARATFRRVDPMQLPRQQRVKLYDTLQAIDRQSAAAGQAQPTEAEQPQPEAEEPAQPQPVVEETATAEEATGEQVAEDVQETATEAEAVVVAEAPAEPTAADLMAEADRIGASDPSAAAAIYQQVLASEDADASTRELAQARLAQMQRVMAIEVTEMRRLIDEAAVDLEAGDYDAATVKLDTVATSDVKLGWFDQQRVKRQRAAIEEHQQQVAAEAEAQAKAAEEMARKAQEEADRLAAEQAEAERVAAEKAEAERVAAEQARQERLAKELTLADEAAAAAAAEAQAKAEAERQAKIEAEAQAREEAERLAAEKAEAERLAREEAERLAAEKTQAEQLAAEKAEAERQARAEQERLAADEAAAAAAAAAQARAEQEAAAKVEAEQLAAEKAQAEAQAREEAERLAAEKADAERLAAEKAEAERQARLAQELELADAAAAEAKTEAERRAAEEAEAARQKAADAEAARLAAEDTARKAEEDAARLAQEAEEARRRAEAEAAARAAAEAEAQAKADADDLLAQYRLLRSQQRVAEAREAQQAGQIDLAIRRYEQALQLNPDNKQAQEQLTALRNQRNLAVAPQGLIESDVTQRQLRAQSAEAEFATQMNEARSQLSAQNFPAALDAVSEAKVALDRNQRFLGNEQYRTLRGQAESLETEIVQTQQRVEAQRLADIEQRRERQEKAMREQAAREQAQEVDRLLRRAMELRSDMQYDEALELVNQALFLDPNNIAGQALKMGIEDSRILIKAREDERKRALAITEHSLQNLEATIPYSSLIEYPMDWPQLTVRRLAGLEENGGESEATRRVRQRLREPVPMPFDGNRLQNVIDYLRNTTGVNFFVNWPAMEVAGVDRDTLITLQLQNVPAERGLEMVLRQASAGSEFDPIGYTIIDGIVTISTERDLQKTTETRVYDIRDLLVQVPNFTDAPEFDLESALEPRTAGGGGGGGGGGGDSLFGDEDDDDEDEEEARELLIEDIITLIQDSVGRQEEWAAYGGDVSSVRELNGNLIVKTTPNNHIQTLDLLTQLRETRAIQISVEARFLLVDQNFLEEVGVDMDFAFNTEGSALPGNWGPVDVTQGSFDLAERSTTTLSPERFGTGRSMDLTVSYLDDLQVNLVIRATQAHQRAISLTAPRVTFFNGQRAYVVVARQISFISELEPIPDAVGFEQTIDVVNSGVVLDVEGTISADRRYVTMTLRPSLATVAEIKEFTQTGVFTIDGGDGGQDQLIVLEGVIQLPTLELTEVASTVSVPDQGTLLLGGQRLVEEVEVEAGVPVLSKIPLLNRLFTNTSTIKDERTLLILVKPTIIIQSEEEEKLFPGLLDNPQQYNVGRSF